MQQRGLLEYKAYTGAWMQQHLDAPSVLAGGPPNWSESPGKDCWRFLLVAVWWRPGEMRRHGGGHCMHMNSFSKARVAGRGGIYRLTMLEICQLLVW